MQTGKKFAISVGQKSSRKMDTIKEFNVTNVICVVVSLYTIGD
jgi:hypothetical protein